MLKTANNLDLTGEINKTSAEISKKNTLITNIKGEIRTKENTLQDLNDKLRREKESLEKILRFVTPTCPPIDKKLLLYLSMASEYAV